MESMTILIIVKDRPMIRARKGTIGGFLKVLVGVVW